MRYKTNYNIYDNSDYAYHSDTPSMTLQAPAGECDINTIIAKYHATGFLPQPLAEPLFGDVSDATDLQSILARQDAARELFYNLPSHIREHLNNDPMELLARSYDPNWCATTGVDIGLFSRPVPVKDFNQQIRDYNSKLVPDNSPNPPAGGTD